MQLLPKNRICNAAHIQGRRILQHFGKKDKALDRVRRLFVAVLIRLITVTCQTKEKLDIYPLKSFVAEMEN